MAELTEELSQAMEGTDSMTERWLELAELQ